MKIAHKLTASLGLLAFASGAFAHVSLTPARAQAGTSYEGAVHVSHGCDSAATKAITVRLPAGFTSGRGLPKTGWTVTTRADEITWTAAPGAALPSRQSGDFVLAGKLPAHPAALWFKVKQSCEQGALDWSQVPASGTSTDGMKNPAMLLQVLSPGDWAAWRALPQVQGGWVRASVPGQQSTGAYMRITASEPMQLVGVITPAAGVADVHEMKLEGSVMRMRALPHLDLPAGTPVELKPSGLHVMLQDLKHPLAAGATVPMTLVLRNAAGVESRLDVDLPVLAQAPGAAVSAPAGDHKH